ncbi:MAG: NAD(P)-binding protein [Ekhidna sp.]
MERRKFIVNSSLAALTLPFWLQGCKSLLVSDFPIYVDSDHATGHLIMKSQQWERVKKGTIGIAIVGGGIAGVTAAYQLRERDIKLFELSSRLGGTASAKMDNGITFSQGAHYELAYPETYGSEVISMLEQLEIIKYQPWNKAWSFQDRQHIIPFSRRQQCYENGKMRKEVISDGFVKDQFFRIINEYNGDMHLPTRLISTKYRELNAISFIDFLSSRMKIDAKFQQQLDYHMMDDWGGKSNQVSALAGIHYFACRPYLTQSVDLFSPPEGNHYFSNKMVDAIDKEKIKTSHLVSNIEKIGTTFSIEVIDVLNQVINVYSADQVIYAGQKHALKYIYPKEADLFDQKQAPWMVMNFVCDGNPSKYGFWQNEFLGENRSFLGFIDSSVQDREVQNGKRVITAYYCLSPEDREYLTTIPDHKQEIADETLGYIQQMLDKKLVVESCHINVMGHAMSIPVPGFLFNDANEHETDLIYAGVDNGRLPLLFEALDSGICAAKLVDKPL